LNEKMEEWNSGIVERWATMIGILEDWNTGTMGFEYFKKLVFYPIFHRSSIPLMNEE